MDLALHRGTGLQRRPAGAMWPLAVLLAGICCPAAELDAGDVLDYGALFEVQAASDPQVSPDGARVVYVRRSGDVMTDRSYSNLWIVDFNGERHRPLTRGSFVDSEPRWSADGKHVAFVSNRSGSRQIHSLQLDTGQLRKVASGASTPADLAWSPDGTTIAYVDFVAAPASAVARMPEAPAGAAWAPPPQIIDKLMYRFNGVGYLPNGYFHIFLVPSSGGTQRQLTRDAAQHTLFYHAAGDSRRSAPVWSPDGRYLLFVANLRADYEYQPREFEIHQISVARGDITTLTNRVGPDYDPAISPDGKLIAYVGYEDRRLAYQVSRLHVMHRDGSGSRVLTGDLDYTVQRPRWSGDGRGIYFIHVKEGISRLAYIDLQGRMEVLADDLGTTAAYALTAYAWGADYSVSANGRFAVSHATIDRGGDIATGVVTRRGATAITDLNGELLGSKVLGEIEELRYRSSADGLRIRGWIIKPPHFEPSRKYPVIVALKGGISAYGNKFDLLLRIMAAKGYIVLYMNQRGSTSFGETFANLAHDNFPGEAYADVMSGLDELVKRPYVDERNVFATGPSLGGQMTLWVIGKNRRFAAAVAVMPVVNRYSSVLTADHTPIYTEYRFKGLPWERAQHYLSMSPISLVGNVNTPTMIITGEEDYRTPMSESEQYYKALKLRRVDATLVRVPGEPHALFFRSLSHQYATLLNTICWFERYRTRVADGSENQQDESRASGEQAGAARCFDR